VIEKWRKEWNAKIANAKGGHSIIEVNSASDSDSHSHNGSEHDEEVGNSVNELVLKVNRGHDSSEAGEIGDFEDQAFINDGEVEMDGEDGEESGAVCVYPP